MKNGKRKKEREIKKEREKGVYEGLPMARHGGYDRWKKCARGAMEEGKKIKMGNK